MTQDELALRIRSKRPKMKISGTRLSRYENGRQSPRLSVLIAIAEETGKPLDFFRTDDNGGGDRDAGEDDEEEDSELMLRLAYDYDRRGEWTIADDLRRRARRSKFRALKEEA